jgi:hypothetical protein
VSLDALIGRYEAERSVFAPIDHAHWVAFVAQHQQCRTLCSECRKEALTAEPLQPDNLEVLALWRRVARVRMGLDKDDRISAVLASENPKFAAAAAASAAGSAGAAGAGSGTETGGEAKRSDFASSTDDDAEGPQLVASGPVDLQTRRLVVEWLTLSRQRLRDRANRERRERRR